MAAERATTSFLDLLRASGLLSAGQLAELSQCAEARDASPTPLARVVLRHGWLTRFQLNAVAAGRARDLTVGPYALLDRLGEGGMGAVFKARHQHMNRVVALKVIRKEKLSSADAVRRFYQEVQLAATLSHPNIVMAYDAGPAGSTHYLAMEYVEGVDLARLVKERGRLPAAQACDYVRQAALGLQHAHEKGLVHRDVKPANLLVSRAPGSTEIAGDPAAASARGDVVKLLDMGLARLQGAGDTGMTRLGAVIGTPDYLAPEQAMNSRAADIRADLYSLGCTLYYLLTGRPPFTAGELTEALLKHQMERAAPLAERGVEAPAGLQAVLDRLMAKAPADRYQTPAELVEAITPFCREGTLDAGVFDFRPEADSADDWGSLTLDGKKEKGAARPAKKQKATELSRTSAGAREIGRKRRAAEQANRRSKGLLLALAAGGGVLALVVVGVVLYLALRQPAAGPVAQGPRPPAPVKNEVPAGVRQHEPPPNGVGHPPPADGGNAVVPPEMGGNPLQPGGDEVRRFEGHTERVRRLAVSPDGRQILTAGFDKTLRLWDVNSGRELRKWEVPAGTMVHGVAFLPDGRRALSCCQDDKAVTLWDVTQGRAVGSFAGNTDGVWQVAVSGDGHVAASCGREGTIFLWDVDTGHERRRLLEIPRRGIESIALSRDGKLLLVGGMGGEVAVWDTDKGEQPRRFQGQHAGNVMGLALSADGKVALSAATDKLAHVWNVETGRALQHFQGITSPVCSAALSPDGRRALTGGLDGVVTLWDAATGKALHRFTGHTEQVCTLAFCPDGRHALSGSYDKTVRLWRLPPEGSAPPPGAEEAGPLTGPAAKLSLPAGEPVAAAALSPDGKRLVFGASKLHLWDLGRDREVHDFGGASFLAVRAVAWSADGRRILVGGVPVAENPVGVATLFEADTGKVVRTFTGHPTSVWSVALSPDGRQILTAAGAARIENGQTVRGPGGQFVWDDTELRRWDVATGKELGRYRGLNSPGFGLSFSPDGKTFCAVGGEPEAAAIVWDVDKPEGRRVPLKGSAHVHAAVSRDARAVAYLSPDQSWHIYDLKEGKETCRSEKVPGLLTRLAWSRDGRYIACGTGKPPQAPGTAPIYLADAATGKVVGAFEGHPIASGVLALSDDGRLVFSYSADGARLWEWQKAPAKP